MAFPTHGQTMKPRNNGPAAEPAEPTAGLQLHAFSVRAAVVFTQSWAERLVVAAEGGRGDAWSQSCAASMSARSCRCVQGATGAAGGGSARLMSRGRERAVKGGRLNLSITRELRRYAHPPSLHPTLPPPGRTRDSATAKWKLLVVFKELWRVRSVPTIIERV